MDDQDTAPPLPPTTSNRPSRPSPLEIPEILAQILPSVEEHTLRRSVPFVCHQWLILSRDHIFRTVRWEYQDENSNKHLDDRFRRLKFAGRLEVQTPQAHYEDPTAVRFDYWAITLALLEVLDPSSRQTAMFAKIQNNNNLNQGVQEYKGQEEFLKAPMLLRRTTLRELVLGGWAGHIVLKSLHRHLGTLTHVQVMTCHFERWHPYMDSFVFQPQLVIMNCPLLQSFKIAGETLSFAPMIMGPWVHPKSEAVAIAKDSGSGSGSGGASSLSSSDAPFRCRYLETFILQGLDYDPQDLETLLSVSPNLKVLKVINRRDTTKDGSYFDNPTYTYHDLVRHLQKIGLDLQTFHYSDRSNDRPDHMELEEHRGSKDWTFCARDLSPELIRGLQTIPNVVTTLELLSACNNGRVAEGLHTYLCSSPHLVHLRAARTPYPVAFFDINNRSPRTGNSTDVTTGKKPRGDIWMCRFLETLHLGFKPLSKPYSKQSPKNARLIFGYISRVCPNLREIRLQDRDCRHATAIPRLSLKSGFCLLARMKWLRRLWVGTFEMNEGGYDLRKGTSRDIEVVWEYLNWMFVGREELVKEEERGIFENGKLLRRREVGRWDKLLALEEEEEVFGTGIGRITVEEDEEEGEEVRNLREQLKNVGRLKDVKDMVEEIDGKEEFVSCPSLERVYYCSPKEHDCSPEF